MGLTISQAGDSIVLKPDPIDAVFAVKQRLDIPRSHITAIDVVDRSDVPTTEGTWLRAPGTHLPGLVRYGSYGKEPLREFWMVRRQDRVVMIDVRDWAYHRLVLGARDPDRLAEQFRSAI